VRRGHPCVLCGATRQGLARVRLPVRASRRCAGRPRGEWFCQGAPDYGCPVPDLCVPVSTRSARRGNPGCRWAQCIDGYVRARIAWEGPSCCLGAGRRRGGRGALHVHRDATRCHPGRVSGFLVAQHRVPAMHVHTNATSAASAAPSRAGRQRAGRPTVCRARRRAGGR
jgi:hypothetical protein